ncbi:MAG TPA: ABC transporter permease subunit, partial [Anaerolineales bacterium]|nr:ABC transporter permease subunit [Anaerolineales bacterium]
MTTSSTSSSTPTTLQKTPPLVQARVSQRLSEFPWWVLFILLMAVFLIYNFATNQTYQDILLTLYIGIRLTITITISAFILSMIIGLLTAFGQMSRNALIRNIATLYVQIVRGIPS